MLKKVIENNVPFVTYWVWEHNRLKYHNRNRHLCSQRQQWQDKRTDQNLYTDKGKNINTNTETNTNKYANTEREQVRWGWHDIGGECYLVLDMKMKIINDISSIILFLFFTITYRMDLWGRRVPRARWWSTRLYIHWLFSLTPDRTVPEGPVSNRDCPI